MWYALTRIFSFLTKKSHDLVVEQKSTIQINPIPKSPPSDFILLAINAFIISGKREGDVKEMLCELNVQDEKVDLVVDIAQKVYKAWCDKQQRASGNGEIGSIREPKYISQLPDSTIPSPVILHLEPRERYAELFRALMGKETYRAKPTEELLYLMATYAAFLPPIKLGSRAQICEVSFNGFGGTYNAVRLRVITVNSQRENFFPYLITKTSMPFNTNEIFEWENNGSFSTEAEVKGARSDKVGLSFFATDYAVNRERYLNNTEINIRISAFAFYIYEYKTQSNTSSSSISSFIPDFNNSGKHSMYNFTGTVLKVRTCSISSRYTSYILTVKLFENGDGQSPAAIDVFVNTENITSGQMRKNIIVKGTLWLQGEIAE